jgi:DNA-binding SARP family transcriptional activator
VTTELVLLPRVSYHEQEITGPRLRGLLGLLAGDLRSGCSTARLVEGLWPDGRPENPTKALQVLVSRVRAQLGSDVIVSTATGYRLSLSENQVDTAAVLLRAAASARYAGAGDHAAALGHAEAGLALWEGELLRSEAVTVGPSAALARYDAYRRSLRDELGTDPGHALQAVYRQLLQGEGPVVRNGVPHEPNPLLGRDDDIVAVAELLRTSRVTSVVGPGGLGKTRLAHVVSRRAEQRVVHLIPLAGVTTDDDVASEVASVLGVGEPRRASVSPLAVRTDVLTGIVNALGPGPALLVLDNCEHVVRGAAELVRALVSMTRDVRVLTRSGTRFRMLETVREFSTAHRQAAEETDLMVGGFLAWARDFGVAHHESLLGADPLSPLERVRAEQDNLVQALPRGRCPGRDRPDHRSAIDHAQLAVL